MKSQLNVINSDWKDGQEFLSKNKNMTSKKEVSFSSGDYYAGREHLIDLNSARKESFFIRHNKAIGCFFFMFMVFSTVNEFNSFFIGVFLSAWASFWFTLFGLGIIKVFNLSSQPTINHPAVKEKELPEDKDFHEVGSVMSVEPLDSFTSFEVNTKIT